MPIIENAIFEMGVSFFLKSSIPTRITNKGKINNKYLKLNSLKLYIVMIKYTTAPIEIVILFFGLNPAFSMSLKNSNNPKIETIKNSPATLYLFHIIAKIRMLTKMIPVVVLINSSFKVF